jgi:hypothetical protein
MNDTTPKARPVALWARTLAGVVATVSIAALAEIVFVVVRGDSPPPIALLIGLVTTRRLTCSVAQKIVCATRGL